MEPVEPTSSEQESKKETMSGDNTKTNGASIMDLPGHGGHKRLGRDTRLDSGQPFDAAGAGPGIGGPGDEVPRPSRKTGALSGLKGMDVQDTELLDDIIRAALVGFAVHVVIGVAAVKIYHWTDRRP